MEKVNVNGLWKDVKKKYVNVNGVWKEAKAEYVNINGTWHRYDCKLEPFIWDMSGATVNMSTMKASVGPKGANSVSGTICCAGWITKDKVTISSRTLRIAINYYFGVPELLAVPQNNFDNSNSGHDYMPAVCILLKEKQGKQIVNGSTVLNIIIINSNQMGERNTDGNITLDSAFPLGDYYLYTGLYYELVATPYTLPLRSAEYVLKSFKVNNVSYC